MTKGQRKIWVEVGLVFISLVSILCLLPSRARAGFGISPPYVRNENLTQGSHFEQKIILVRDKPDEDWQAELIFNVPEANNWFSVDKGTKFILPKGEKQTPIVISVDVPEKAEFKEYKGFIRVKTAPLEAQEPGTVAIALGGQIDVDLSVIKEIFDFKVRGVRVSDLEEGHKWLFWYFPGIIKFSIQIENIGNVNASPSKVQLAIYDSQEKELEEVVSQGRIHLSILPRGTIPNYKGGGFLDLAFKDKLTIILLALVVLGGLSYGSYRGLKYVKKRRKTV